VSELKKPVGTMKGSSLALLGYLAQGNTLAPPSGLFCGHIPIIIDENLTVTSATNFDYYNVVHGRFVVAL
jgi:hypothetical protein